MNPTQSQALTMHEAENRVALPGQGTGEWADVQVRRMAAKTKGIKDGNREGGEEGEEKGPSYFILKGRMSLFPRCGFTPLIYLAEGLPKMKWFLLSVSVLFIGVATLCLGTNAGFGQTGSSILNSVVGNGETCFQIGLATTVLGVLWTLLLVVFRIFKSTLD